MRSLVLALLLLLALPAVADENRPIDGREPRTRARHFIITAEHTLRADERGDLAAAGVELQQTLPGNRYVVRAVSIADDPRIATVEEIAASRKIDRSAIREAAHAHAYMHVRLVFHSDVSFAAARQAIESIGGAVDQLLTSDYVLPQRLQARIPFGTLTTLATDDRVFAIYGAPLKIRSTNAVAAQLSHVTPLFSAPYNLSGAGVVLSEFELAHADASHVEFGGRLTNHITDNDASSVLHATHTAGTMIATGINPAAKGMAPNATLHIFGVSGVEYPTILSTKQNSLPPLGVVADNNSWSFCLGWQAPPTCGATTITWMGGEDYFGAYDGFISAPYDKIARASSVVFVQSSGNDADQGGPSLTPPFFPHAHSDDDGNIIAGETFCYSQNGSGTDCTAPCTATPGHCELTPHPTYGPFITVGPVACVKNALAVGAVTADKIIAPFSSRGPTHDGRVKPDLVAKGVNQFSTLPSGGYGTANGTSMSAPVVTGIAGLLTEQWRKTFSGATPLPVTLRTLLIAGADDLGTVGPDYTFGFGLANAQASADLIIADNNTGSRIRVSGITQGQQVDTPINVTSTQNLRVVAGWLDPEVLLLPDDFAEKTLVNDIDIKVIDPVGNVVLPYVLDKNHPEFAATRAVNSVDNTEEVEIANAAPGMYHVIVTGTTIATGTTQQYALIANAPLSGSAVACNDSYEPNDTEAAAFGFLVNGTTVAAGLCSGSDVDFYKFRVTAPGIVSLSVTTTGTPVRVTLYSSGVTPVVQDVMAGTTAVVRSVASSPPAIFFVRIEPVGAFGPDRSYTLVPSFPATTPVRRRATQH